MAVLQRIILLTFVLLLAIYILSLSFLSPTVSYYIGLFCCSIPFLALLTTRILYRRQIGRYSGHHHRLSGKVILITGGTSGIGYCTALDLAKRGAKSVIITGRDEAKGRRVCQHIQSLSGNSTNVHFFHLELSQLESVRQFAQSIATKYPIIDILINNAACSLTSHQLTSDGLEKTMAANYFGPVLLTECLLPNLKASDQGRIINLSSMVYKFGKIDLENLQFQGNYSSFPVYASSKLANLLYTRQLARTLRTDAPHVTVNAVHPGIVSTGLFREAPALINTIMVWSSGILFKGADDGSQTTVFCAVEPDLAMVSGVYFEDCQANFNLLPIGKDDALGAQLLTKTKELCGISKKSD